jgi:hypothetical protein
VAPKGSPREVNVGIIHAPRNGGTSIQTHALKGSVLDEHRRALKRALTRVGDGSLRPGGHCVSLYCPALRVCPSQTNALVALKAPGALSHGRVGEIHQTMQLYDRHVEQLKAEMRAWVREHGPGVRPDGQLVVLKSKTRESLSKTSITEALGAKEAERVIDILAKGGCVKTVEFEELRAEADRGK